ncbi:RHS repeat domain-containing protein, partial [Halochromatium glycolicum]
AMGNLTATTNPDNFTVGFTHDPLGRVRSAFDEEGREARRTLDVLGRMRALIDPNGNAETFTYHGPEQDARLEQSCDALARCTTFDYDANGNVTVLTDNAGHTTLTTYDALDRPVRIVEPAYDDPTLGTVRPVTVYVYDTLGNLTQIRAGHTDASGTNPGADVLTTQQIATYDDWGRTLTETDALGRTTRYTPNVHGDLVRIEDAEG